jgi:predicted DNA-binding protein with PD1-like motif
MDSKEKKNLIFIRLFENEEILDQIKKSCKDHNVKTAVILSGIGQIKNTKLGYFKKKGDYCPESFDKPLELLSLTGNICKQDNEYFIHTHSILGDEKKRAFGGHLIEGKVSVTAEIIIIKTPIEIKRELDKKTGLQALNLE